jgi:hypothetical protein
MPPGGKLSPVSHTRARHEKPDINHEQNNIGVRNGDDAMIREILSPAIRKLKRGRSSRRKPPP